MDKKGSKLSLGDPVKKEAIKSPCIPDKAKIENSVKKDSSEIDILCESLDWNVPMINDDSLDNGDMLDEFDIYSLWNRRCYAL